MLRKEAHLEIINSNSIVKLNKNILKTNMNETSIILNLDTEKFLELNITGKAILDVLEQADVSITELLQKLLTEYSGDYEQIEGDVMKFIKKGIELEIFLIKEIGGKD